MEMQRVRRKGGGKAGPALKKKQTCPGTPRYCLNLTGAKTPPSFSLTQEITTAVGSVISLEAYWLISLLFSVV